MMIRRQPISETGIFPATVSCLNSVALPFDPTVCVADLVNVEDYTNDLGVLSGTVETADLLDPRFSLLWSVSLWLVRQQQHLHYG